MNTFERPRWSLQVALLITAVSVVPVSSYSNGMVFPACNTMVPVHLSMGPTWTASPYKVSATQNPDGSVDVTLESMIDAVSFRGFLLEARNATNHQVGNFVAVPPSAQILQCGYNGGAVSHKQADDKRRVTVLWMQGLHVGDVTFRATFVRNYFQYWTRVFSPTYTI